MTAYYNEHDPDAAAVLRVLIDEGLIAPGIVDERSIEDVLPNELARYTQVHLFAGFGIWSLALRLAGVSDDTRLWTCSCPCQPFSAAGKGDGFADERHLWPSAYHLIAQRRPPKILGEQVAAKAVEPWIDLVHADLEALGYAFGCVPFPSAGVGCPGIRDRAYWGATYLAGRSLDVGGIAGTMANANGSGYLGRWSGEAGNGRDAPRLQLERLCDAGGMGDAVGAGRQPIQNVSGGFGEGVESTRRQSVQSGKAVGDASWLGHTGQDHDASEVRAASAGQSEVYRPANIAGGSGLSLGRMDHAISIGRGAGRHADAGHDGQQLDPASEFQSTRPGPTNGPWRAADWLLCRDGKWRPVEPGTFPLAHAGTFRNRVAALRGAGNAINVEAAKVWIESVMEPTP